MHLSKAGGSKNLSVEDIPILGRWDKIPTPEGQRLFDAVWHRFLNLPNIPEIIEALANTNREIRYRELECYLRAIQYGFSPQILGSFFVPELVPKSEKQQQTQVRSYYQEIVERIPILITQRDRAESEKEFDITFRKIEELNNNDRIIQQLNILNSTGKLWNDGQLMILEFPKIYLNEIEKLLWPKWYTACFMKDYRNSSVWGHYGNKHKGVCLIFEAVNTCESNGLKFTKVKGKSERTMPFHEVSYADKPGEVDFFQSIGRLSVPELIKLWYTDSEGNRSECASHIRPDGNKKEDWQDTYWKKFYCDITTKTKDWAYEQEWRLILGKEIRRQRVHREEIRTRTYDFNSLKGIIFGIKTSNDDKLRIIKIIQKKCGKHKRTDFKFYQAYYSQETGDIRKYEIQLT